MKLFKTSDIEKLTIEDIHKLYSEYVNKSQVDLISKFGFGQEIAVRAEGNSIFTNKNKKILDFTGGIGVLNHGHNHPKILKTREWFLKNKKMEVHKNFFSPYVAVLSHNIAQLLPKDLNISYFSNSGSDANEGALKLAYKYHEGKRDYVLFSNISFHGKRLGVGNITGSRETSYFNFQQILKYENFVYNNKDSVEKLIKELRKNNESNIYAIIIEPFSASYLLSCEESFLKYLRNICDKENIVLIYDEVYSGWCKTGKLFYFMNFKDVEPDVLTSGKSLGGGKASISAYTCKNKIFKKSYDNLRDATLHSTTFNALGEETIIFFTAYSSLVKLVGMIFINGEKYLSVKSVFITIPFREPDPRTSLIILGYFVFNFFKPLFKIS